jgi:hypothetical protein
VETNANQAPLAALGFLVSEGMGMDTVHLLSAWFLGELTDWAGGCRNGLLSRTHSQTKR